MINASRRKAAVALALMAGAAAGALAWRPTRRLADGRPPVDLEALFPRRFGAWAIDTRLPIQLVSPDQQAMLDRLYNQTLSRSYVNARGERIMLSVAYGGDQSDGTRAHIPEVCYPAQGFQIMSRAVGTLALAQGRLPVRRLVARQGGRNEPITYWIVIGERVATSGTEVKLAQLSYSVRGVIADGMLVRVSSISNEAAGAFGLHEDFVRALGGSLPPLDAWRVLGAAA